jgi:hypothetical protein
MNEGNFIEGLIEPSILPILLSIDSSEREKKREGDRMRRSIKTSSPWTNILFYYIKDAVYYSLSLSHLHTTIYKYTNKLGFLETSKCFKHTCSHTKYVALNGKKGDVALFKYQWTFIT